MNSRNAICDALFHKEGFAELLLRKAFSLCTRARVVGAAPYSDALRRIYVRYKHATTAVLARDSFGGVGAHHFSDHQSRYPVEIPSCRIVDFRAAIKTAVDAQAVLL